jgi:phosphoglucosamine mutase
VPTPVVPFAIERYKACGGVMITASHNPIDDNGLKFFAADGFKIPPRIESTIEQLIAGSPAEWRAGGPHYGSIDSFAPNGDYKRHTLRSMASRAQARQLRVVLDCAHGATCELAPAVFAQAGFDVSSICDTFDGSRINVGCGATDLTRLRREVRRTSAALGLAFDGDGDRVLAVDATGREVSGDIIIAIFATRIRGYHSAGMAVMTQMTNMGVEQALRRRASG